MLRDDIDDFKKRSNIDEMDSEERKELFDKFVEKGGKVIDDGKKSSKAFSIDKEKQKDYLKAVENSRKKLDHEHKQKSGYNTSNNSFSNGLSMGDRKIFKTPKFILRLLGGFSGVVKFLNGSITNKIYGTIKNSIQDSFIDLSYVGATLLNPKVINHQKFKIAMMKHSPLSYEFIVRLSRLYNEDDFKSITDLYEHKLVDEVKPEMIRDQIKNIFRVLFLFYSSENRIIESVTDGLEVTSKTQNLERGFVEDMLLRTERSLKMLYSSNLYYKVYILYCISIGKHYRITNRSRIMESLDLDANEIGTIAELTQIEIDELYDKSSKMKINENSHGESDETGSDEDHIDNEKDESDLPEDFLRGKKLFDSLDFSVPPEDSYERNRFFEPNDKILYCSSAFEYFDKEFSFILTSNNISYTVELVEGSKLDLKGGLNKVYINFNKCKDFLDEYMKVIEQIHSMNSNLSVSISKKFSIMQNNEIRQLKMSGEIREKLLEGFSKLSVLFNIALEGDLIKNGDEKLIFDKLDGKRFLKGKSYKEAVDYAKCFSKYMSFLLEKGFLSGSSPFIKER